MDNEERIVQSLNAIEKNQGALVRAHLEINQHLWWLSLSVKIGLFMLVFSLVGAFFFLFVNDI